MRTLGSQNRLRALSSLVVVGTLALTASVATGLEPGHVAPIPDSAYAPVVLDREAALTAPGPIPAPTPALRPLADPQLDLPLAERPQPPLPDSKPIVKQAWAHSISGRASWYCNFDDPSVPHSICHNAYPDGPGFDAYGAAGPGLRAALGSGWRNNIVMVCGRRCVEVKLVDWCKCTGGSVGTVKLIDLYEDVYSRTGGNVTIRW